MLLAKPSANHHLYLMNYRITLVESEEGVAVWCDDLPGCASQGATGEEAEHNSRRRFRFGSRYTPRTSDGTPRPSLEYA